jgi:hypothetical protein
MALIRLKTHFFLTLAAGLLCAAGQAQWTGPVSDIPAFHTAPPPAHVAQPQILHGSQLTGPHFTQAWQRRVYQDAAKVPNVLYQLPCYCRCDLALGHTSLQSCFTGLHGAECDVCAKEGEYAYRMTRKGWTPQQIRAGIERGEWKQIDLESLGTAHARHSARS